MRYAVINSLREIIRPGDKEQALQAIRDILQDENNPGLRIHASKTVDELSGNAVINAERIV